MRFHKTDIQGDHLGIVSVQFSTIDDPVVGLMCSVDEQELRKRFNLPENADIHGACTDIQVVDLSTYLATFEVVRIKAVV